MKNIIDYTFGTKEENRNLLGILNEQLESQLPSSVHATNMSADQIETHLSYESEISSTNSFELILSYTDNTNFTVKINILCRNRRNSEIILK